MEVKLAAQLLSSSVAKGLQLARSLGLKGFQDSEPTEHLCIVIDRLFDVLNSKNLRANHYKAPLSAHRLVMHRTFLEETASVLLSMTTEDGKILICKSRQSMGVIEFVATIKSVLYNKECTVVGRDHSRHIIRWSTSMLHLYLQAVTR